MKKLILVLILIPGLLFSVEVKKKSSSKDRELKVKIFDVKKDTLDKDEDGISDSFLKKLRKIEKEKKKIKIRKKKKSLRKEKHKRIKRYRYR